MPSTSSKDERQSSSSSGAGGVTGEGDTKGDVHRRAGQHALGAEGVETCACRIIPSLREEQLFLLGTENEFEFKFFS